MSETQRLRIMIVDDSGETRTYLRNLLQFEANMEVVGMAANGRDAVNLALEVKPDLILMDINMPVMDGISAAEIVFQKLPNIRVVMMSVQSEMAYLRRAMQVGAREYLIKPFTHAELLSILGTVSTQAPTPAEAAVGKLMQEAVDARARAVKQATLVTVFSPRGGAGCSTVAVNLAIALQGERKANVLVVEGNLRFGALDAMLNLRLSRNITDLLPSLDDGDPENLHATTLVHSTGIRILAAPPSPEMADLVTVRHLEQIIALGRRRYDYLVADMGNRLDEHALRFLDAANRIFVLLTPDIPAIKNVRVFLELAQGLGYEPEKIVLALNRANPRGGINAEAIQRHLKHPIAATIPESPRVAQGAINRGVPLILLEREAHKEMPVTRQLLTLAEMIPRPGVAIAEATSGSEDNQKSERVQPSRSVPQTDKRARLGRLFGRRG